MSPAFALALALATAVPPVQPGGDACAFALMRPAPRPAIVGAAEITKIAHVVDQPDSPLRVARLDLSAVMFGKTGSGIVTLDLANVSDRPIRGGAIGLVWHVGYTEVSGTVRVVDAVMPGAAIRVDAEFADDLTLDLTTMTMLVSVRSVSLERCRYEPARTEVTQGFGPLAGPAGGVCEFKANTNTAAPAIAGPPDVVPRVRVTPQPGSPLRIRRVDVSRLRMNIGESWIQLRGEFAIEVQNVSDREIQSADVRLIAGPAPGEGHGTEWKGTLKPGGTLALRAAHVATIADLQPGAADPHLLAVVERVRFGSCDYHPARGYPAAERD